MREGQVVGAWILPQGDTGDPAKDVYFGNLYSIKGRTLEEVTGQDFQTWRQSRLAAAAPPPEDSTETAANSSANMPTPASHVTWMISSLNEPRMKAPMSVRLMLPQRFRLTFGAPVNRASVEQALEQNLGAGYTTETKWADDQTLDFTIKSGPVTERNTFLRVSAAGGHDQKGLTLMVSDTPRGPAEFLLGVGTASEVWRWTLGDKPRLVSALPGAFDVLSVSPDGTRLVLRLFGIPQSGGWPPVGPPPGFAYLYDMSTQRLQRLGDVSGWLSPQWLADGSLVISGSDLQGTTLMLVTPDGVQTSLVKGLDVVDYAMSPAGKRVAAFILAGSDCEAKGDLWLITLPDGKRQEFKGAYTPARTPNGVPAIGAVWSPDGAALAFADKTGHQVDEGRPYRIAMFDPANGKFWTLLDDAGEPRAWSPDGKYLLISDTGIVDARRGIIALFPKLNDSTLYAQFGPRGDRVYVDSLGLLSVPSWQPVGNVPTDYKLISWGPSGDLLGLADNNASAAGWAVYKADGTVLWSRQDLFPGAMIGPDPAWTRFVWSPDGRFVAIPGIGVGDKTDGQMHALQSDLGNPIGWNRSGALFVSPNTDVVDAEYVKPTQFGR